MRKRIEGKAFDHTNPLESLTLTNLYDCSFSGAEYALRNSREIILENCSFEGEYPLQNVEKFKLIDSRILESAVCPLHGCVTGKITDSDIKAPQALYHCKKMTLHDCSIISEGFGRDCDELSLKDCNIHGENILHGSWNLRLDNVEIRGEKVLQDADTVQIYNSFLNSDGGLKACTNVTIVDSVIKGDFLGWNCENITFIGCRIQGMQPLCHCRGLKLIDCVMEGCELAFEYSQVNAAVVGHLNSIKNPLSGKITADSVGAVVRDDPALESTAKILVRA